MHNLNQQKASTAAANISEMERGTILKHEVLKTMLEVEKKGYSSAIERLRKVLKTEYGLFLENIRCVGYQICPEGRDAKLLVDAAIKGHRKMEKAKQDIYYINDGDYSETAKNTVAKSKKLLNTLAPNYGAILSDLISLGGKDILQIDATL